MITTRTEDKNKNNFKMIMENFRNWNEKNAYTLANENITNQSKIFLSNKLGFGNNISLFESWSGGHINDYGRLILEIEALNFLKENHKNTDCAHTKTILDLHELRVHLLLQNVSPKIKNLSEGLNLKEPLLVENVLSTGGSLLLKFFGDDVAKAAIKGAPSLSVQSIKAADEPFIKHLAKGGAAPKGFAQWAAKNKGLVDSIKAATEESAERGFGAAAKAGAQTAAKAGAQTAAKGGRVFYDKLPGNVDEIALYIQKNGADDAIMGLLRQANGLLGRGDKLTKLDDAIINRANNIMMALGKKHVVNVPGRAPVTLGRTTDDAVIGGLKNIPKTFRKGSDASKALKGPVKPRKPAPTGSKPRKIDMRPMERAKVPRNIQTQVADALGDLSIRKMLLAAIGSSFRTGATMTKAQLSKLVPQWFKKLDKTGKVGVGIMAASKLAVGIAIYLALREDDPTLPPLDPEVQPDPGFGGGPVNSGGILAQIAQAAGYNADVSGLGDGMLNDTSFQQFLSSNNVDIDSIQDGTELIPYINQYLQSMGAPPLNFDAATADANSLSALNNFLQQLQSGGAQPAPGPSPTPGPNPAPAPAGSPNWLKRKADKQAELIRQLNQGVTGLQEQNLGVGGLKIDKQFQDNTDSVSPAASANTAAAPVPGTEKQSVTLKMLQQSLIDMGYNLGPRGADGEYGPATYKAIRKFQADNKLQKDGLIGPNTFSHMRRKDKKLMSQSATMGMDVPKEIEKTLDKIAKAPIDKKSKAYMQGALSSPEDIKKLKDKARSVRKDAINKLKQAQKAGDVGEMNRQQQRIEKATGVYRSAQAGEDEARKLKSTEKLRKRAIDAGYLYMLETEWKKNYEIYSSWDPMIQEFFLKEFGVDDSKVGSTDIKTGKLGRLMQIYRTGRNSKNKPALKLQKKMKMIVRIFKDELNKSRKDT